LLLQISRYKAANCSAIVWNKGYMAVGFVDLVVALTEVASLVGVTVAVVAADLVDVRQDFEEAVLIAEELG
jgi:MinD-like ATPase involved in chromosome partitioning or flagellar assembly